MMTPISHSSPTDLLPYKLVSHQANYLWVEDYGLEKTLTPRDLRREREEVVKKEETYRSNQRKSFNQQHRAKELPAVTGW